LAFDEAVAQRVREHLARKRGVEEKRMFGGLAWLREGRMFIGVQADELMVRVGKDAQAAALSKPHVRPMDFTGRPIEGYVYVAPEGFAKGSALGDWVEQAWTHAGTLPPPKPKKVRR
jgi:TfoX/Sxy family transcriptional regulator of competence genes